MESLGTMVGSREAPASSSCALLGFLVGRRVWSIAPPSLDAAPPPTCCKTPEDRAPTLASFRAGNLPTRGRFSSRHCLSRHSNFPSLFLDPETAVLLQLSDPANPVHRIFPLARMFFRH